MIKYVNDSMGNFISWLNSKALIDTPVYITILHGYDCVETETGTGFAVYMPCEDAPIMMVAGEVPPDLEERFLLESVAHEYMHHFQHCENRLPDEEDRRTEEEADIFAKMMVDEYLKEVLNV